MRHFVVYLLDKVNVHELRETVRSSHLRFIQALGTQVKIGGPLLDDDGETKIGGMYILESPDIEAARNIAQSDPYFTDGVAASLEVRPWRWQTDNR